MYKKTANTFEIFQLKSDDKFGKFRFENIESLEKVDLKVEYDNYRLIYIDELSENMSPEDIYIKFNEKRPKYFKGHSLSVSDVIVINKDGNSTAHFIDSFGFKTIPDFLYELNKAKDYIRDFIANEYVDERKTFEFENLEHIEIAYTTTEDEKHDIQTTINLVKYSLNTYIDDILVHKESYGSLKELNEYALKHLDFESLIYVDELDIKEVEKLTIDKDTDLDGLIDRFDSDFRDSSVMTNADLVEKDISELEHMRVSLLGELKSYKESIKENRKEKYSNNESEKIIARRE